MEYLDSSSSQEEEELQSGKGNFLKDLLAKTADQNILVHYQIPANLVMNKAIIDQYISKSAVGESPKKLHDFRTKSSGKIHHGFEEHQKRFSHKEHILRTTNQANLAFQKSNNIRQNTPLQGSKKKPQQKSLLSFKKSLFKSTVSVPKSPPKSKQASGKKGTQKKKPKYISSTLNLLQRLDIPTLEKYSPVNTHSRIKGVYSPKIASRLDVTHNFI